MKRFEEVSNCIFKNKEVWVLLIIWDANGNNKKELLNSGFDIQLADNYYYGNLNEGLIKIEHFNEEAFDYAEIIYLKYENYLFNKIKPIIYSKAGFELAFEDTAGLVAYFISFEEVPVLLNLYDDRGMEVLTHGKETIDNLSKKFSKYVMMP